MKYDPEKHHRHSIRLKGYDYSQAGAYFITICTQDRECFFGDVAAAEMQLNAYGQIVQAMWDGLPHHNMNLVLDAFVVMPNHVHGILILTVGPGLKPAPTGKTHGLPEIIRGFKTYSARRINLRRDKIGAPLWQRNYFEHIIRND